MRIAVVRVDVDPSGELTPAQLDEGMTALLRLARHAGVEVVPSRPAAMPVEHREVRLLVAGTDPEALRQHAVTLSARAFGTAPVAGVTTYLSRGTDDDARGVLAGFGLTGRIRRVPGDDGVDVVYVTLSRSDCERVPESRIRTALEAALNCEVHLVTG
ncbi:hypothetical protein [Mycobacterium sp.]|uniref:hypothetical protein n=1 Tax=Mycobacterium sp. TaxID=1785 RepID=UPI0031D2D753